ncbi:RNA-directed DNA polymerase, eukaryota, reverse transcriptase zinc-binding domain protein, partial [Tanacetum coccineum]
DIWEIDRLKEQEDQSKNVEDVFVNQDGMAQTLTGDNVIGSEKKELWRDIMRAKRITSGWPWLMTGDFNVTLNNEERSNDGSRISNDMQDFIDCVNEAEMED